MRCGEGWIDVASFTAIYHVTPDESNRPVRYTVLPFPEGAKIPQEFTLMPRIGDMEDSDAALYVVLEPPADLARWTYECRRAWGRVWRPEIPPALGGMVQSVVRRNRWPPLLIGLSLILAR
jgi:hypothetical protein